MSQKTNTPIQWSHFPDHLGFGIADLSSKRIADGLYCLDYFLGAEKIIEVQLSTLGATIHQFLKGEHIDTTHANNLEMALKTLFEGKPFSQNPIHDNWVKAVSRAGNVLIRYSQELLPEEIIFPSVQTEQVVIPVPFKDKERIQEIYQVASRYPHRIKEFKGVLAWTLRSDGTNVKEPVALISIILPVAYVPLFIKEVNPYILPGRIWRAYADNIHGEASIGSNVYYGAPNEDFYVYMLGVIS